MWSGRGVGGAVVCRRGLKCAVREIVSDFSDWPSQVCSARNQLAHQAYTPEASSDGLLLLLIAVDYSLSWVLRTVLLRRAGIPDEVVRRCYENDARYGLYRANVRSYLNPGRGRGPERCCRWSRQVLGCRDGSDRGADRHRAARGSVRAL
ncbi:HEPN domain-containing protein [Rhodococcus sp. CX]|uniref:HEPN domain-containing protein n=2 Tax=unclassified Rhodococcus (in: high G+C Gram-positive bacteria) TaxID=192944 RepID=UPI0035A8A373